MAPTSSKCPHLSLFTLLYPTIIPRSLLPSITPFINHGTDGLSGETDGLSLPSPHHYPPTPCRNTPSTPHMQRHTSLPPLTPPHTVTVNHRCSRLSVHLFQDFNNTENTHAREETLTKSKCFSRRLVRVCMCICVCECVCVSVRVSSQREAPKESCLHLVPGACQEG